jgi:hypothetical protein
MTVESTRVKIIEEAKRIENDALYSAKGHYEAAESWTRFHLTIGIPTAILSAIAGASALAQFDYHNIIAGSLAILVAALTAVATFLNPNEKATSHQIVGNKYNALRNKVHIFCNIDSSVENSEQELIKHLKDLATQRDELNQDSPPISSWAYKKAQKVIENKTTAKSTSRTS